MHPLLAEPTNEQRHLLEVIYRGRELASSASRRRWPIFQYVEQELSREHGLDAMHTVVGCPTIGGFGGNYGWTWCARRQPEDEIGLTIAGMAHLPAASGEVALFLETLAVLVETHRSFKPSPTEVVEVKISATELRDCLAPTWRLNTVGLVNIRDTLGHEPAAWHCSASPADEWVLTLSPFLRRFGDLNTSDAYLERAVEVMAPPAPVPEPFYPSPLSLPEAIDYLNAIWRLHAGAPLLRIGRAEAAAKLVLDCANADEFDSRLSALCGILDALYLPDDDGHKLADLETYLQKELGEGSSRSSVRGHPGPASALRPARLAAALRHGGQSGGRHEPARDRFASGRLARCVAAGPGPDRSRALCAPRRDRDAVAELVGRAPRWVA